jgi:hypothetical protein
VILVTLMKEALCSSEKSVLTRATRRNIPGNTILLKFYLAFGTCFRLLLDNQIKEGWIFGYVARV